MSKFNKIVKEDKAVNENHQLAVAVIYLAALLDSRREKFFDYYGINPHQFRLLYILHEQFSGSAKVCVMKEHMIYMNPDMSRMVVRLQVLGLVEKERTPDSSRAELVKITKKGIEVLTEINRNFPEMLLPLDKINSEDKKVLLTKLEELAVAMEQSSTCSKTNFTSSVN